eukprot:TRINITY_DN2931_c0_g1_i2.p1 TRINITY_DN2931_c0_g1~~TRINITY_DN2931_c0_g1_i2.p1  ORF type:complete len:894 (-),score=253.91 TRINITY_DN2931_c0_g1_i2:1392-4073(-)
MADELEALSCSQLIQRLLYLFETDQEDVIDEVLDWFLFTYSPEHAFDLVQSNSEALKDPMLLEIIMTKVKDVYEPEIFLETLNVIASLEGNEEQIAASGAVRAVVLMMGRDMHNARSQQLGCKVLATLSANQEVRLWIGKMKGISRIVEALQKHSSNPEVVIECCRALTNLAYRSRLNKTLIMNENAITFILESLKLRSNNIAMVCEGLATVRNLLSHLDTSAEIDKEHIIKEVLFHMRVSKSMSELLANSIWILIGLMSGFSDLKNFIFNSGALGNILLAMETYRGDEEVQLAGCTAFGLFCKKELLRKQMASQDVILALLGTLKNVRHDREVLRAAMKAFFRLAFSVSTRERIAKFGEEVISQMVEGMKNHSDYGPLQRMGIITLLQLSKDETMLKFAQRDAVSQIILVMNTFTNDENISRVARLGVKTLVTGTVGNLQMNMDTTDGGIDDFAQVDDMKREIEDLKRQLREKESNEQQLTEMNERLIKKLASTEAQSKEMEDAEEELNRLKSELLTEQKKLDVTKKKKQAMLVEIKSQNPTEDSLMPSTVGKPKQSKKEGDSDGKKPRKALKRIPTVLPPTKAEKVAGPTTTTTTTTTNNSNNNNVPASSTTPPGLVSVPPVSGATSENSMTKAVKSTQKTSLKVKDTPLVATKNVPSMTKETAKETPKETTKEVSKETTKETTKEATKETTKEAPKDPIKDATKDGGKERETPKVGAKEGVKDSTNVKDGSKEGSKDSAKSKEVKDKDKLKGVTPRKEGKKSKARSDSRSLNRRTHSRSSASLDTASPLMAKLESSLVEKDKEIADLRSRNEKLEKEAKRLEIDLNASTRLITTLQKETKQQAELAAQNTGVFAFQRHQKKIKTLKTRIQQLQISEAELKKELETLKGRK